LGGAALPPPQFTQQLVFGSFLGGSGGDEVRAMKLTPSGQLILAGTTWSPDFPVQPGAFDPDPDVGLENTDAFVAGLSADGATLEFATFYGGSGLDSAFALEVDAEGNLLISGGSGSTDLPTTTGAFDRTYNGGPFDGFVARLSADGSALLHASYLGGSGLGSESITSMQLDPLDGSVVVSGPTSSSDWPTSPGSFSEGWLGSSSVFLSRFAPDLTELTASTYFGTGSPAAVRLLADGSALQSGTTSSAANLTITQVGSGAFAHADPPAGAGGGSYLGRLSADFSTMLWSTWTEASFAAVPRDDGSIVLVGATREDDFPTTPGAYSSTFTGQPGVDREHVACAITADGQQLLWATYITSESLVTSAVEAAVDDAGRIYFVSAFSGGSYPFTENAWDTELVGLSEGLLTVLDPVGSQLLYASLLGVGHGSQEVNFRLELDGCGGAYVSGDTFNREFPTTPGALDETYNGAGDAFLVRVNAISPWTNLGGWVGGVQGRPVLTPSGPLCSGDPTSLDITDGPSGGTALLVLGFSQLAAPFKAGVLLPAPDLVSALPLDAHGSGSLDFTWPEGSHSGARLWLQAWLPDAAGPAGYSATNGVLAEVP